MLVIKVKLFLTCTENLLLRLILMCVCCASGMVDIEIETPRGLTWNMYVRGQELHSWTPCVKRFLYINN